MMRRPCGVAPRLAALSPAGTRKTSAFACSHAVRLLLDAADRRRPCRRARSRRSRRRCSRGRRCGPSSSITSSANASPADGPPTLPASICTFSGSLMSADCAGREADDRVRLARSGSGIVFDVHGQVLRRRALIASVTTSPGFTLRERGAELRDRRRLRAVHRDDHVGRLELADRVAVRARRVDDHAARLRDDLVPEPCAARPPPAIFCESVISRRSACRAALVAHAGRHDQVRRARASRRCGSTGRATRACSRAARRRRRSRCRRARRRVAALHAHERRDGVRLVGQQQVVVRRERGRGRAQRARAARRATPASLAGVRSLASKERSLQAAVDDDRLPGDVARAVGREEADDVAELARVAPAAQRDLRSVLLGRSVRIELVEPRRCRCGRARRS